MFKSIKKSFQPDHIQVMETELNQARLSLLEAQTALEWAASQVEYNQCRIQRLERTLYDVQRNVQSGENSMQKQEVLRKQSSGI